MFLQHFSGSGGSSNADRGLTARCPGWAGQTSFSHFMMARKLAHVCSHALRSTQGFVLKTCSCTSRVMSNWSPKADACGAAWLRR